MSPRIVPIVEGPGDATAVPVLLRRILDEQLQAHEVQVASAKKLSRSAIKAKLPKALEHAARETDCRAIMVMMDADKECARHLAEMMSRIAAQQGVALPIVIVCPNVEYEAWLIASIDTIRGRPFGMRRAILDPSTSYPDEVERIRDAKGWLSKHMLGMKNYKPTLDQAPLTAKIDLGLAACRSRSFRRLCHAVEEAVDGIRSCTAKVTPPTN